MSVNQLLNLEPLSNFVKEVVHSLQRPAVGVQLLLIAGSFLLAIVVVRVLKPIKNASFFQASGLLVSFFTLISLSVSNVILSALVLPTGLIADSCSAIILLVILLLTFRLIIRLSHGRHQRLVECYRDRLIFPIFICYCLYLFVQTFGDPGEFLFTPIFKLFNTPFSIADGLSLTFGIFIWINFSSLFVQTLELLLRGQHALTHEASKAVYTLLRYGLIGLGLFVIVGIIGVNPTVFGLITGGLSVGIGLGLKEIISNFLGGIWLLIEGSTKPGDIINLNSLDNSVEPFLLAKITDCGLRAVTVTNVSDHSERIIPNNIFFSNQITTYTKNHNIIARKTYFGVSYGSDPAMVIQLVNNAIKMHPEVLSDPAPSTTFIAYGDSSLNFYVKFFIQDVMGGVRVTSELNLLIWETLKKHSIEIPFPQRTLHFSDNCSIDQPNEDSGDSPVSNLL